MATICGGHLQIGKTPAFVNITQAAWTTSGVVAVESIKGRRDHFVVLKDNGQRSALLNTLSGSLYGLTRNNQDELTFVRYDPATKHYSVLRDIGANLHEIANTAADFVFAPGLFPDGTYAVPETFRTASGGFDGQLQLVSPDGKSRIVKVPGIPVDVTWLNNSLLLIRADISATTAGDYLFSLKTQKETALAGGWLTICSYKQSVVVARLDGTVGLLSASHSDGNAVQVVGKLPLLPLACAPTQP